MPMLNLLKVFGLSSLAFFIGIFLTPLLSHYLYRFKLWRKEARTRSPDGSPTPIFHKLHEAREMGVPRMGGILIWLVPLVMSFLFLGLSRLFPVPFFQKLNFLSRSQTWLPLFTLIAASFVGAADDLIQVYGKGKYVAGGMLFSRRLFLVILIALIGACWFYVKLGKDTVAVPFVGEYSIGLFFIPFFVLVMISTFSGGIIDGLDGLAGGVMASIFSAYAGIAWFQNQIDLATFAGVILGALLSFLWFNIPPARFYMGETGILGLTAVLTVLAFLTNTVLVLPIIALPLVLTSLSVIIQFASKRFLGRKVFLVAPLHHHFEARGWPSYKVTMRYWIFSVVFAVIGMVIALISK